MCRYVVAPTSSSSLVTSFVIILISAAAIVSALPNFNFTCIEEGRFPDPTDCTSFYDCVYDPRSQSLVAKDYSCKKGGFHPNLKKCVDLKKLNGCHSRRARLNEARYDLSDLCTTGAEFVCADCNTMVHCLDGTAYAMDCGPSDSCQVNDSFGGALCHPISVKECSCQAPLTFKRDAFDKNSFFFCTVDLSPNFYKCPTEMVFDEEEAQCVSADGLPPCQAIGVFAHPRDCTQYYTCIQTSRGWVQKLFLCPAMTMYNEATRMCEDPCDWNYQDFSCKLEVGESFQMTKRSCPSNYHWSQIVDTNRGMCINAEISKCTPIPRTSCRIPDNWCEVDLSEEIEEEVIDDVETSSPDDDGNVVAQDTTNLTTTTMTTQYDVEGDSVNGVQPSSDVAVDAGAGDAAAASLANESGVVVEATTTTTNNNNNNEGEEEQGAAAAAAMEEEQPEFVSTVEMSPEAINASPFASTVQVVENVMKDNDIFSDLTSKLKEMQLLKEGNSVNEDFGNQEIRNEDNAEEISDAPNSESNDQYFFMTDEEKPNLFEFFN